MHTNADKTQETTAQSAVPAPNSGHGEATFEFADSRPETVAQRKLRDLAENSPQVKQTGHLQSMANNYAAQQQPVQRKLITQSGDRSTSSIGNKHPDFKRKFLDSPENYYADETDLAFSQAFDFGLSLLSEKIHVIGEVHTDSKFTEIFARWKWIAGGIMENMDSRDEDEKKHFWSGMKEPVGEVNAKKAGVTALERTHTKILSAVAVAQSAAKLAKAQPQADWETDHGPAKHYFKVLGSIPDYLDYYAGLSESDINMFGFSAMLSNEDTKWSDPIEAAYKDLIRLNSLPGNKLILARIKEANTELSAVKMWTVLKESATIAFFSANIVAINQLNIAVTKDVGLKAERKKMGDAYVKHDHDNTDSVQNVITAMLPLRDLEMAKSIDKARLPSIVQVGNKHLPGIKAKVANPGNVVLYDDYADFHKKTVEKLS